MSIQGAVPHNVPLQTAGDTIKLEFRPLSLHFTLFPPSSVWKIKVITVTFIKLRKQDHISLQCCSESIPWVPSRTYPRLLPTHPFDAKDLAATTGMGGFGRRPRGQRESNPTWNAAWGGPRPRPCPAPPPPTWTPQLAGERTALMCGYAGGVNRRTVSPHSPAGGASRVRESAGCPPRPLPGLAHAASSVWPPAVLSLCPNATLYELRCHTELRPTPTTSL